MPQPIAEKVIAALVIEDQVEHFSAWVDLIDFDDVTFWIQQTILTGTPGALTWEVQVSPEAASILNVSTTGQIVHTYGKLLDEGGTDAPVALITPATAASKNDLASASPEDVIRSARVRVIAGATTNADNDWTVNAWITARAHGRPVR